MFLCAQDAFRADEGAAAAGRPHHQQRLDLGACRRARIRRLRRTKHGVSGLTKSLALDGRAYDIACGQIDIGNAVTPLTERMPAGGQAGRTAQSRPEPRMDVAHVARAVVFMASLPLETNVLSMTIMATKMPFVGRG